MAAGVHAEFRARYGPWALVAGASEGLGAEFATQLAARGLHLVLVARREDMLHSLASDLEGRYGVEARAVPLDLARDDAGTALVERTAGIDVGMLVFNAALSAIGPFLDTSLDTHLTELQINCRGPLVLTHTFGRQMLARRRGGMIVMSSLSATMGSALIANYAATKAYNLVLAEGLWDELRSGGVDVLACCPAVVSTPNYVASAPHGSRSAMAPRVVVEHTLAALGREPSVIPGAANRLSAFALRRLLPRKSTISLMGRVMRAMYAR
jgi:short-subunit dehydrogenase